MARLATLGLLALIPTAALSGAAWGQAPTPTNGSVGCAKIVQAAANGMTSRIQADNASMPPPQSVSQLSCLGNFFNGVGLNLVTNLLNPGTLLQSVEGQICGAVKNTWSSWLGTQCGLTLTGFNLGFGGIGGGLSCPSLSFGGGGPPIASVGGGVGSNGGGLYINGNGLAPTGYNIPSIPPGSY